MGACQTLASDICTQTTDQSGDGCTNICTNGQGQSVFVGNLARGQTGQSQRQRRMAGLHHDGRQNSEACVDKKS